LLGRLYQRKGKAHTGLTAVQLALSTAEPGTEVVNKAGPASLAKLCTPHQDKWGEFTPLSAVVSLCLSRAPWDCSTSPSG